MITETTVYPFDPSGTLTTNRIEGERQVLTPINTTDFFFIVPLAAPYFAESMVLIHHPSGRILSEGVDYFLSHRFHDATLAVGKPIYGSVSFIDKTLTGVIELGYQTLGGEWTIDETRIANILAESLANPRITLWEQITDLPREFPPIDHQWDLVDLVGATQVVGKLGEIEQAIRDGNAGAAAAHVNDVANPHQVTKAQVGLGLVANLPLADSIAAVAGLSDSLYMTPLRTREAIQAVVANDFVNHVNNLLNPHGVTASQIGLGLVANFPMASSPEAVEGTAGNRYISPLTLNDVLVNYNSTVIVPHVNSLANPHGTTKDQVGLSNVMNYGIATTQSAIGGVDDTFYMTPLRTREAIDALFGDTLINHINGRSNPHDVSKEQVGLGLVLNLGLASLADARSGSGDSGYMTPRLVAEAIAALASGAGSGNTLAYDIHLADRSNPHQVDASQVGAYSINQTDVLLGQKLSRGETAANAGRLEGLSVADLERLVKARFDYPAVNARQVDDGLGGTITVNDSVTWTILGSYTPPGVVDAANPPRDVVFYLTGGDRRNSNVVPIYLIKLNIFDQVTMDVEQLAGVVSGTTFGYTRDLTSQVITIYSKNVALRNPMSALVMSDPSNGMGSTQFPLDSEPVGIVYAGNFTYSGAAANADATPGELIFGSNPFRDTQPDFGPMFEIINVVDAVGGDVLAAQLDPGDLSDEMNDFMACSSFGSVGRNAVKADLGGWRWNATSSSIENIPTGQSLMAFTSPYAYLNYTFEVVMSSTDQGSNALGICAAFVRSNGKDHGLYVLRTPGGLVVTSSGGTLPGGDIYRLCSIGYNLLQDDAVDLGSSNAGLVWGDGVADADRAVAGPYNPVGGGWDVAGVVAMRVFRSGNLIIVQTSQFGSTDPTAGASFTIDLSSRPELAVFMQPTTFGLVKYAQGSANFQIAVRPDSFKPYVLFAKDVDGNDASSINRFNGSFWESQAMNLTQSFIKPGRFYYSELTGRAYASRRNGTLKPINIQFFSPNAITILTLN